MSLSNVSVVKKRTITVSEIEIIDDEERLNTALYIEDALDEGEVTLCGKILSIREKETKNGKPFFIFEFEDGTGKFSGVYFSRAKTVDRIRRLKEGDEIITIGSIGSYNGQVS